MLISADQKNGGAYFSPLHDIVKKMRLSAVQMFFCFCFCVCFVLLCIIFLMKGKEDSNFCYKNNACSFHEEVIHRDFASSSTFVILSTRGGSLSLITNPFKRLASVLCKHVHVFNVKNL